MDKKIREFWNLSLSTKETTQEQIEVFGALIAADCAKNIPGCRVQDNLEALLLKTKECNVIAELNHAQWLALENIRLLAARHRSEKWTLDILRFCEEAGNASRIFRLEKK